MNNIIDLNIKEASEALKNKKISALELTQAYIEQAKNSKLNVYITETFDNAIEQAQKSDTKIAKGEAGVLEGIPVAMKDLFCTKGVRTTAASKILEDYVPEYESTISAKIQEAGAVTIGKSNLDEFAMGSSTVTSGYGITINPWIRSDGKAVVPGGSSGGSAAAVAGGLALCATGSDTGGSIRQPAAFCGIVGLKVTYGLCSRFGAIAFVSSLDTMGPMARTVDDTALMLSAMAGYDNKDSTSYNGSPIDYLKGLNDDIKGLKIGIPKEYRLGTLNPEVSAMWDEGIKWLENAGATIVDISLPHTKYALPSYYIIAPAEASSNLARYDGVRYGLRIAGNSLDEMYSNTRSEGFGAEVKRRILTGTNLLSSKLYETHFLKAQKVRRLVTNDFVEAFKEVDFILTPTAPTPAFAVDEVDKIKPEEMYLNDVYTIPTSLAGIPAISVPAKVALNGLPLGLQVIGNKFTEAKLLNIAKIIENNAGFDNRPSVVLGGAK